MDIAKTENDAFAVTRNCENAKKRISDAFTVSRYHMEELARYVASSIELSTVGERTLNESLLQVYGNVKLHLNEPVNGETDSASFESARACLITSFCASLCRIVAENGTPIAPSVFFPAAGEPENKKIAYMRNALSDEAYRIFSKEIKGASVVYPSGFSAVCEEVYYGRAGYCILPFESLEDGTLSGFIRLIAKYELCPIMTCLVPTEHSATRFVLLGRTQYLSSLTAKNGRLMLKLTVDRAEKYTFIKLTSAAGELGFQLRKTESVPLAWREDYTTSLTFEAVAADLTAFLLYLALEVPECAYKAVYIEIEHAK